MDILAGLLLLLLATRILGEVALRFNLPASVGELGAGALLGGLLFWFSDHLSLAREIAGSEQLARIAEAGMFFLLLQAGIDLKPRDLARQSGKAIWIALGGALLPLGLGFLAGLWVLPDGDLKLVQSFLIGVVLAITSIPAAVKILREQGMLTHPVGQAVVSAAIFDDIIGLILLAVLTTLIRQGTGVEPDALLVLLGKALLFFAITVPLGTHVYPRIRERLKVLQLAAAEFSSLMMVALAYALLAEVLGLHWILGAFMAGIFFEPERVGVRAYNEMRIITVGITGGFLGPLFFASIGLEIDYSAVLAAPLLVAGLIIIGSGAKFFGAAIPARLTGFPRSEAAVVGTAMGARGAVELIVISIAVEAGLFAETGGEVVSALIVMAVTATMISAIGLRFLLRRISPPV